MIVKDLVSWLQALPQYEEVKWEARPSRTIVLMIHDTEDPHDDYESEELESK